ncbi:MAG: hypothetical protein ACHP7P_17145 [Terriglobales bacterium]
MRLRIRLLWRRKTKHGALQTLKRRQRKIKGAGLDIQSPRDAPTGNLKAFRCRPGPSRDYVSVAAGFQVNGL